MATATRRRKTSGEETAISASILRFKVTWAAANPFMKRLYLIPASSQAALITREGELWAYAGQLSNAAAQ